MTYAKGLLRKRRGIKSTVWVTLGETTKSVSFVLNGLKLWLNAGHMKRGILAKSHVMSFLWRAIRNVWWCPCSHKHHRNNRCVTTLFCNICNETFTSMRDYKLHRTTHGDDAALKDYICPECNERFISLKKLRSHQRTVHATFNSLRSKIRNIPFEEEKQLVRQEKMIQAAVANRDVSEKHKRYECKFCVEIFNDSPALSKHEQQEHAGEKPYKCNYCDKRFRLNGQMKVHERIHTGETPYKCEYCHKALTSRTSLTNHLRIHTERNHYYATSATNVSAVVVAFDRIQWVTQMKNRLNVAIVICGLSSTRLKRLTKGDIRVKSHMYVFIVVSI